MHFRPCPYCSKSNHPSSTFCIHCGEPLDEDSLAELTATRPAPPLAKDPPKQCNEKEPFSWNHLLTPGRKVECLFGLAVLFLVVGYAFYSSARENDLAAIYHAGVNAAARQDYDLAMVDLGAAQGFLDSASRMTTISKTIRLRDTLYSEARAASANGKWWSAASALRQLAGIQAGYKDSDRLLSKARSLNGIVVYRWGREAGGDDTLRISEADGGDLRVLPDTGERSRVDAVSSDGAWLVFSNAGVMSREVYLYSVVAGTTRPFQLQVLSDVVIARFTPGNDRVWIMADSMVTAFDLPNPYDISPLRPDSDANQVAPEDQTSDNGVAVPGSKYATYLVTANPSAGSGLCGTTYYSFYAAKVQTEGGEAHSPGRELLWQTALSPDRWLPATHLLADGETLLTNVPPTATSKSGLYAYNLQTGKAQLLIEGATDAWYPGYATLPDLATNTAAQADGR